MADDTETTLSLDRAKERVLEDERMRSDLADDEAQVLLDWAMAELEAAPARGEPLEDAVDRVRARGREVNKLVGQRQDLDQATIETRLRTLSGLPEPAPAPIWSRWFGSQQGDAVDNLMARWPSLAGPALVAAVLALGTAAVAAPSRQRPSSGLILGVVLMLLAVLLIGVVLFGQGLLRRSIPPTPAAPPTVAVPVTPAAPVTPGAPPTPVAKPGAVLDGLVAVYFTDPKDVDRPEDRRGGLDERLTAFLKEATTTIDVAIYDLDLENVTDALVDASKRGIRVRVVTDTDNLKNDEIVTLQAARIPVIEDKRSAIMHHKFAVVDRGAVWMGSWNFTVYDTYRYNNNGALWRSKPLAEKYAAEFEKLFAGQFGARSRTDKPAADVITDEQRGIRMEVHFTPEDDPEPVIVRRVQAAQRSVVFMAYSFTSDPIGGAMREVGRRGVIVRGVFEKTGTDSASSPSEFRPMKEAGLDVLQDGNRYLMHHKVIVIDERILIFGSYNFSANAQDNNENLLIVDSPELARLYTQEFERVYARAAAAA